MTRVLAATIAAAVLGGVVIVAAQAPAQAPTQTQAQAQAPAAPRTPTTRPNPTAGKDAAGVVMPKLQVITGCLQPGAAPDARVVGGNPTSFVVQNAMMAGSSAAPTTIKLEGLANPGVNMATLVNRKVEVTGLPLPERGTFSIRIVKEVAPTC